MLGIRLGHGSALALLLSAAAVTAAPAPHLTGDWYNTDYGVYPDFAVLSLGADGRASIAGLNGRRRSGDYTLGADGHLVIRMTEDGDPGALRVIINSVPVLEGDRLQLQARQRTFFLSRAPWLKAEIEKAGARYRHAETKEAPRKRRPASPPPTTASKPGGTPPPAVQEPFVIKVLLPRLSGDGAGAAGCGPPVLDQLREAGWRLVEQKAQADAIVDIELSGIEYKNSFWAGRYYRISYRIDLKRARDEHLLGSTDGAERATGDGWFEACSDVADEVVEEIGDLVEDAQDD